MPCSFRSSRRIARFRAPVFCALVATFLGCNSTDSLDPDSSPPSDPGVGAAVQPPAPEFSTSFAGGIAFGTFAQPTSTLGATYNGGKMTIGPYDLKSQLAAIKARGARIVLMMAGSEKYYKDSNGHFSLTKWKQRVDRFKGIDFSSYINDGTILAHYMIDEPQDPSNWNGQPIPPSTVDAMGQYSKQLWPGMATVVRTEPRYFTSNPHYVDAAWAQYLARFGDADDYIRRNVADAQNRGLALVIGLNLVNGGTPTGTAMSASEVKAFGAALLSSSYPCAFISWQYNSSYLSSSSVADAMKYLRNQAQSRSTRACRGS
jgi:hypothetical protein